MTAHSAEKRPRSAWPKRATITGALLLVVITGACAGGVAADATHAREELLSAAQTLTTMRAGIMTAQPGDLDAQITTVQTHARAAVDATTGPHWGALTWVPWVGDHIHAVQTAASAVHGVAFDVLPELATSMSAVNPAQMHLTGAGVDLAPLAAAAPHLASADAALTRISDDLSSIDQDTLRTEITGPLRDLQGGIEEVASLTGTASRIADLLPPMAGAGEPRTYLLLAQNPAEARAAGGLIGAVVGLQADNGAITVVDHQPGDEIQTTQPVLSLTDAEHDLFTDLLATDMRDVTFTPDFPRAAALAAALWEANGHGHVDGVLSVDPAALGLLLDATGPVTLPDSPVARAVGGELTGANAQQTLLNTVYLTMPNPSAQDLFFAATTAAVFGHLLDGAVDSTDVIDALAEAARQDRLRVWSAHPEEQDRLTGTVLAGDLTGQVGNSPVAGVYLNDGSRSKIGFYQQVRIDAEDTGCVRDRQRTVKMTVTLTNDAPDPTGMPSYVVGGGVVPAGHARTNVLLYAPAGGSIENVMAGGVPGALMHEHDGLTVAAVTVEVPPGESVVVTYDVRTGADQAGPLVVHSTPVPNRGVTVQTDVCGAN